MNIIKWQWAIAAVAGFSALNAQAAIPSTMHKPAAAAGQPAKVASVVAANKAGTRVLILQDSSPWGTTVNESILNSIGMP
jgi:hypothetical protein